MKAFSHFKLFFKEQIRSYLSAEKIEQIKNFLTRFRYLFDWIYLSYQVRFKKVPDVAIILCIADPCPVGGTELQIQMIAKSLKSHFGNCLVLISGKIKEKKTSLFWKHLSSLNIPLIQLGSIGLIFPDDWPFFKKKTPLLLQKIVGKSKICHFFNPDSTALAPLIKKMGLAIYYTETGMPALDPWWKMLPLTLTAFDYVISVSEIGLKQLKSTFHYQGPSCVIPSFCNLPPPSFSLRKPIENTFHILYFGRMATGKGIDLLIASFSHVIRTFPYATLSLIGSGGRVLQLKKLVKALHLENCVQFIDFLPQDQLFSHLLKADVFCLPSYSEGLPSSILEAMSVALPIVATQVGGIPEIIEKDISGLLIPPKDEQALTKALCKLAADPLFRIQMGEEGFLRWKKIGTQQVIIDRLLSSYALVLK